MTSRLPLGQVLLQQGCIDGHQLRAALAYQQRWGGRIGEAIAALGFMREADVLRHVARHLDVPFIDVAERVVAPYLLRKVPEKLVRARKLLPVALGSESRRGPLVVATAEPQDLHALDEVAFASGLTVRAALASARDLARAIERHYGAAAPVPAPEPVELPPDVLVPMQVVPFARTA